MDYWHMISRRHEVKIGIDWKGNPTEKTLAFREEIKSQAEIPVH